MSKRVVFVFIFALVGFLNHTKAQVDPPELRCISIEDNGDVTLNWIPTLDPLNQFVSYQVYRIVNGVSGPIGPALTNRLQFVYTDKAVPLPPRAGFGYYIVVNFNDGSSKVSLPSDTLSPMELNLTKINPNTSGNLQWNLMRTNPLATWDNQYNLKRKFFKHPLGVWDDNFDTPNYSQTSFQDNVTRCLSGISYQIEIKDASGCVSKSNPVIEDLLDNTGVASMGYSHISVGKDGNTKLVWDKHPDNSVVKYILIYIDPTLNGVAIDTMGLLSFEKIDSAHSAKTRSQCYVIAPLDSCGNTNGGGDTSCTIHLRNTFDPCAGEIYLAWNPYKGWGGVEGYDVFMGLNGDTTKIGSVDGRDTLFTVKNVNAFSNYSFYVVGKDNSSRFLSNSNIIEVQFSIANQTKFLHLRSASVESAKEVKLKVLLDRSFPLNGVKIYRGLERKGPYQLVGLRKLPPSRLDTLFSVYDTLASPYQINYVYYLEAIDTCGQSVRISNKFRTLFLRGESDKYVMENDLKWVASISYDSTAVEKDIYSLYRSISKIYSPNPIRSLWSNLLEYSDDISEEIHNGDEFCYRLKLTQAASDTFVAPDTSFSNEVCFKMEPDIFIPNSFTPNQDGINENWRPKTTYIIPFDNYSLTIFDRWGKVAFETDNPLEGWNGERNNGMATAGVYNYRLEIVTVHGSKISRKGIFNLVR